MLGFDAIAGLPIAGEPVVDSGVSGTGDAGSLIFTGQVGVGSVTGVGVDGALVFTGQIGIGSVTGVGADGSLVFTGQDGSGSVSSGGIGEAGSLVFTGQDGSGEVVSTQTGAGKRRRVLLDVRGKIHEFETEEGANAFLASLEKVEEKTIEAKAKRIVKTISRTGNAFVPQPLKPIVVVEGTEQIAALVNMRLAMNQSMLNAAVQRELLEEQKRDDEAMMLLMMMMED